MAVGIDSKEFLEVTQPLLRGGDAAALAQAVKVRWRVRDLCGLLRSSEVDVRRVVAVVLGLVGDMKVVPCLTTALRDEDEQVNQMAEHGLWSIWFRGGKAEAAVPFREGVSMLAAESYQQAAACFEKAIELDGRFGEAFNQCAIAYFFLQQWQGSITFCRKTLEIIPTHFGAIAGMGHSYTQMGDMGRALMCYRRAIQINPRMTVIQQMVERLQVHEKMGNDESGLFVAGSQGL